MNIGRLRQRVAFDKDTNASGNAGRDTTGAPTPTWTEQFRRWAEWIPAEAREAEALRSRFATLTGVFLLRYDGVAATLSPRAEWRVRWILENRTFDILGVIPDGRRRTLQLPVLQHNV